MKNLLSRWRTWLPLLVTATVIALLVHFVDLDETLDVLQSVNPLAIAVAACLYLLDRFSMAYKWNVLLRVRGARISTWEAFRIYMASGFVGYVMPASVGSDVFRAARLAGAGSRLSNVSATIVLERVLGLLAILTMSTLGLSCLVMTRRADLQPLLEAAVLALACGSALMLMSVSSRLNRILRRALRPVERYRITRMLYSLHDEYTSLSKGGRPVLAFFLLSIVNQFIQALMFVPLLVSLGARVELWVLLAILPLNKAFIQFMPAPAGFGVAEGSMVVALSLAHVTPGMALACALLLRAIDLSMLIPMGIAYAADCWLLRRAGTR